MRKMYLLKLCMLFLVVTVSAVDAVSQSNELNKPVPDSARQTFKLANQLAEQEKFAASVAALKKTIAAAPQLLPAHVKYISLKAYFMGQQWEVKAEYENLMAKNPANPIYPAALGIALFAESSQARRGWFETVTKLAPDWTWGHYAKANLLKDKEPETAVAEFSRAIEKNPSSPEAYTEAIFIQEFRLKKISDAIATAEKMASQPDLRASGLGNLWRLRLKADATEEAKAKLRHELSQIAASSKNIQLLAAVRTAYSDLLKEAEAAQLIERKISEIDSTWYAERGTAKASTALGNNGTYSIVYSGRQLSILNKLRKIDYFLETQEQTIQLEQLLTLNPNSELKQNIYDRLLGLAIQGEKDAAIVKYGEELIALDPKNAMILATVALSLANQKQKLEKALGYVRLAEELTRELRTIKHVSSGSQNKFEEEYYSEKGQIERYKARRARVLHSYGWVLSQMGQHAEAEPKLREALELGRSEKSLSHLAEILRRLNRLEEAEKFALEAKNEYTASIKRQFKNEPAKDFELSTIDGRKVKLSDLKGKVVMLNFWATWCKPCIEEMPMFVKAYNKYKNNGFEILAITVDDIEDRPKVVTFANQRKINFPVLYDESIAKLYGVNSYPTTFFIGKQGNIRYQNKGLHVANAERELETVIEELMKDN
ncbi:MAG TPA: redoxin domain-containing protein [Pyrinomonadaceae bacterium]